MLFIHNIFHIVSSEEFVFIAIVKVAILPFDIFVINLGENIVSLRDLKKRLSHVSFFSYCSFLYDCIVSRKQK